MVGDHQQHDERTPFVLRMLNDERHCLNGQFARALSVAAELVLAALARVDTSGPAQRNEESIRNHISRVNSKN
jgi:hypothetical protein